MNGVEDWVVRADRLLAAGDPLGERIALSMARDRATTRDEQQRLDRALVEFDAAHGEQFLGPELLALMAEDGLRAVQLEWKYGCLVRARIMAKPGFEGQAMAGVVHALVRSPAAARFLRSLDVGLHDLEAEDPRAAISALSAGSPLPALEDLFLGTFGDSEWMSRATLGDLGPLWPLTPKLHTLRLRGCDIGLGRLEHPTLQRLEVETIVLPAGSMRSLTIAKLPELRHLDLRLGRLDPESCDASGRVFETTTLAKLGQLFETTTLPKLEHLSLGGAAMQDGIAILLARSKLLEQLRHLDLREGTMSEQGARALIDNASRFQHLESLNLQHNFIPDDLHEPLRAAIPIVQVEIQRRQRFERGRSSRRVLRTRLRRGR